jgi:hypothetical protein
MSPAHLLTLALCLGLSLAAFSSTAASAADPQPAAAADALPLKKVVLFTSGVGFFQHEG